MARQRRDVPDNKAAPRKTEQRAQRASQVKRDEPEREPRDPDLDAEDEVDANAESDAHDDDAPTGDDAEPTGDDDAQASSGQRSGDCAANGASAADDERHGLLSCSCCGLAHHASSVILPWMAEAATTRGEAK